MAVGGVKLGAWALVMFNVMTRVCQAASASGYCPWRPCGFNGVEVRYPFVLRDDALTGQCYTKYPNFDFQCVENIMYLNFTGNITYSTDTFQVTNIDYSNQTLSLLPQGPAATCRPFDASRFGGLNITNSTTLLLDCATNIQLSCTAFSMSTVSNVCNSTGGGVNAPVNASVGGRWACPMKLRNYTNPAYSSCYLMVTAPDIPNNISATTTLELQFAGNRTLSFINFTVPRAPSPASAAPAPPPAPAPDNSLGRKRKLYIILGSLAAFILFLLCLLCGCGRAFHSKSSRKSTERFRRKNIEAFEKMTDLNSPLSHGNHPMTTLYTLKELERATKNFSDDCKLGSGGFGTVFKGTLDNGVEVAIKRTNRADLKGMSEQFMNEVTLLSHVNHRNLVRLHGCCLEVEIPMLVYEYVPNGDLFQHLQGERPGEQLNWGKRLQIAIDTAEALRYLHSAAHPPIYHRDMKTSNILLDDKFNVKVADFGISRLVKPDATHVSTAVQGTPGYLDPEYFRTFQLTDKSDVYSFGMVLLELVTSLKPVDFQRGGGNVNLMTMALPFIQGEDVKAIADSRLFLFDESELYESPDSVADQMQRVAELASKCLADSRYRRPTMKEVVAELVAIRGVVNSAGQESSGMSDMEYYEEVEMVLVLDNRSSNFTSSTACSEPRYSNSPLPSDEEKHRTG